MPLKPYRPSLALAPRPQTGLTLLLLIGLFYVSGAVLHLSTLASLRLAGFRPSLSVIIHLLHAT
jgi:hypothetical protein